MSRRRREFFDSFKRHTLLKHDILETYLAAWAMILLRWDKRAWFIDGFAGRGKDKEGKPGSPLIACEVANRVRSGFAAQGKERELRVIAIESSSARVKALRTNLAPFTGDDGCARHRLYVMLTIDHRVLDGFQANQFLTKFVEALESGNTT